jgi:hypothetical protein
MSTATKEKSKEKKQQIQQEIKVQDVVNKEELNKWVSELYEIKISDEELTLYYDSFKYKGFDKDLILNQLKTLCNNDHKIATQLILLCALQGPQRASLIQLTNGKTPVQMGISASGQQGTQKISCQRITAATADLAAFLLKKMNVPKRMNIQLPGWLQFPSAGSIKLPNNLRELHVEFSKKFSVLIGGEFREDIYQQMWNNAYYDEKLNLFT